MPAFNLLDFLRYSAHWLTESWPRLGVLGGLVLIICWLAYVRRLDRKESERLDAEAMRTSAARVIAITDYSKQAQRQRAVR